jgi:gliding motility-associated-like protein
MKKNLFPICDIRKNCTLKTALFFLLIAFSAPAFAQGQDCAKVTTTKSCGDKNTGTATATPCTPGHYSFVWDDPFAQHDSIAEGLAAGVYHVIISSPLGFTSYAVTVGDSVCTPFSVPNIMTPNGDGKNDDFVISGLETGTKLTIYNRWGDVVYANNNYNNDWDAKNITDGVYFYVLDLPTKEAKVSKEKDPSKGFIQILTGNNK